MNPGQVPPAIGGRPGSRAGIEWMRSIRRARVRPDAADAANLAQYRRTERMKSVRWAVVGLVFLFMPAERRAAQAEVVHVSAHLESSVQELSGGSVVQSDFAAFDFPSSTLFLPLAARTFLDRLNALGLPVSGGQGLTVFQDAAAGVGRVPTDFGMDLAAFSDTPGSAWMVDGMAVQHRRIILHPVETANFPGATIDVVSSLFLSGLLTLAAVSHDVDMTGARAEIMFRITQERPGASSVVVLEGSAALIGGVGGSAHVETSGVVRPALHSVVTLDSLIPEFPVIHAVVFNASRPADRYPYVYQPVVDEEFDLVLEFFGLLHVPATGVGGAVVFGLPPASFGDLFQGLQNPIVGARMQDVMASLMDNQYPASDAPADGLPAGLCGMLGLEFIGLFAVAGVGAALLGRRRVGRRSSNPRWRN